LFVYLIGTKQVNEPLNKPDYSNIANLQPQSLGRYTQEQILSYAYNITKRQYPKHIKKMSYRNVYTSDSYTHHFFRWSL